MALPLPDNSLCTMHGEQEQHAPRQDPEKLTTSRAHDMILKSDLDTYIVDWDGADDPANPRNWSSRKQWTLVIMNAALTFCQAMSSTMFAPAVSLAMTELGSHDAVVAQLLVSIYVVGLAVGPLVLSPLSELYGRSPIMHGTNAAFLLSAIICAVSVNIPMLLIFRLVMGVSTISLGGAYVADLMDPKDRGRAMNVWNLGPVMAPIVGPIAGGYLSRGTSWRWTYGLVSILGAVWLFVCVFFLPETYAPRLLEIKAARLRRRTGIQSWESAYSKKAQRRATFLQSIARPWQMMIRCRIVVFISMFGAIAYSYMYFMFSTFTDVFETAYGFNAGEAGLAYLGLGIGSIAAQLAIEVFDRWQARRLILARRKIQPEDHLPLLVFAGILIAGGQVCYGWSLHYRLHWVIPIFGTGISGFGLILVFQAVQAYLVEAYTLYAASAIALSLAIRCVFGLTVPLAGPQLYHELGYGWGNTVLALVALVMVPASLWLLKSGSKLRQKSSFGTFTAYSSE